MGKYKKGGIHIKQKYRIFFVFLLLLTVISVAGCGKEKDKTTGKTEGETSVKTEDKFSGKWATVEYSPDGSRWSENSHSCIRIFKSGDSYVLEQKNGTFPAIVNDDRLIVNAATGKAVFTYEDKTGNLIMTWNGQKNATYVRAKSQ